MEKYVVISEEKYQEIKKDMGKQNDYFTIEELKTVYKNYYTKGSTEVQTEN